MIYTITILLIGMISANDFGYNYLDNEELFGNVSYYQNITNIFQNITGSTNLSQMNDVDISAPADGESLIWSSLLMQWINSPIVSSIKWIVGSPNYMYNDTDTLYFNETHLNTTIDLRAGSSLQSTNYLGSDFTGSTGAVDRTLNIGIENAIVDMERQVLRPDTDYEITAGILKIYLQVFDPFRIIVTSKIGLKSFNYLGTDLSGTNPIKYITFGNDPVAVSLERQSLISGTDYSYNGTEVNFDVYITDDMRITIWQ